jgi:uncharacterized protein YndB with AHSA1/START domain
MAYESTINVRIGAAPERVYAELTDLARYPLWNSGMVQITPECRMEIGLQFESKSVVLGRTNHAFVDVIALEKNQLVHLKSKTGMVQFDALYALIAEGGETNVSCTLTFELKGLTLNFAHSVVEMMAQARIKGDLETLGALIKGS